MSAVQQAVVKSITAESLVVQVGAEEPIVISGQEVQVIAPTLKLNAKIDITRNDDGSIKSIKVSKAKAEEAPATGSRGRSPVMRSGAAALPR